MPSARRAGSVARDASSWTRRLGRTHGRALSPPLLRPPSTVRAREAPSARCPTRKLPGRSRVTRNGRVCTSRPARREAATAGRSVTEASTAVGPTRECDPGVRPRGGRSGLRTGAPLLGAILSASHRADRESRVDPDTPSESSRTVFPRSPRNGYRRPPSRRRSRGPPGRAPGIHAPAPSCRAMARPGSCWVTPPLLRGSTR